MPNMFSQKKNVNQNITETHLPAVRMAITKNTTNASENAIKHKPLYTVGGNED
jgi:hypothetical protein